MRHPGTIDRTGWMRSAWPLVALLVLAGCHSKDNASGMTSFSSKASPSATPQLFTIPADQMSHVQVVTVQPGTMARTLRLTGAVAYNAFNTTPVITQVGGPVSRILVVPGDHVKANQPMLDVSSPDYAQLLDGYLKAADSYRLADKLYTRAQDLYAHHAIALQDLEQAESNRTQAHADLNAAEQGMRILGIKNPEELAKAPSSALIPVLAPIAGEVVERLVSPGQVVQAGQTQAFTISDLSTVWVLANVYQADLEYREERRRRGGADRCVSRQLPWQDFVRIAGSRSEYADAAGAHRGGQSRREAEAGYVLHGDGDGRRS